LEGEPYAIKVGLGILKYFELDLKMSTFEEAIKLLKNPPKITNEEFFFQIVDEIQVKFSYSGKHR